MTNRGPVEMVQQEAVAVENVMRGNKGVDVYVVIKNQPFSVSYFPLMLFLNGDLNHLIDHLHSTI